MKNVKEVEGTKFLNSILRHRAVVRIIPISSYFSLAACSKQLIDFIVKIFRNFDFISETVTENKFEKCCGDVYDFPNNKPRRTNQCCEGTEPKQQGTCVIHRSWLHVFNNRV